MTINLNAEQLQDWVKRYTLNVPRYTSYPTAPHWEDGLDQKAYLKSLSDSNRPLSLYVHLPFCQERCLYCGCNVVISKKQAVVDPYIECVLAEMDLLVESVSCKLKDRQAIQLHLGGGTPTFADLGQLRILLQGIEDRFNFADNAEKSVEVDPCVTSLEQIDLLREFGFNRVSLGVQDLDLQVQEAVSRVQSTEVTERMIEHCRSIGFDSLNLDLMVGLPHQTLQSFQKTLDQVAIWRPDRIALFNYAHMPQRMKHQAKLDADAMPRADERLAIYCNALEILSAADYELIGIDHFALVQDELAIAHSTGKLRRNFMGYTTRPQSDVLAFGMSSISESSNFYVQNHNHLAQYQNAVKNGELAFAKSLELSTDDLKRREIIMEIMCNASFDIKRFEDKHSCKLQKEFAREYAELERYQGEGLLDWSERGFKLTAPGQLLARIVASCFDSYLQADSGGAARYSSTL